MTKTTIPKIRAAAKRPVPVPPHPSVGLPPHLESRRTTFRLPRMALVVLGVAGACVLFLVVMGVGVYAYGWNDSFTNGFLRTVPYPVASVRSDLVSLREFRGDVATLRYYYDQQAESSGQFPRPSDDRLRMLALDRLVKTVFLQDRAQREGVTISEADVDAELAKNIEQAGSRENIERSLQELYNWSLDDFRSKILRPFLLREKMQEHLNQDATASSAAKARAESALARVRAGNESFDAVAEEVSDDPVIDLGFFGGGETTEAFEQAVQALEPGATSDIVQTQFGFHIIQLVEKIEDPEQGIQYHAKHMLIKVKDLDQWIAEELRGTKVVVFDRTLRWNKDQAVIELRQEPAQELPANVNATTNTPITPAP